VTEIKPYVREALQARAVLVDAGWDHDRFRVTALGSFGEPWTVVVSVSMPEGMVPAPWTGIWSGVNSPGIDALLDDISDGFDAFGPMPDDERLALLEDTRIAGDSHRHAALVSAFSPYARQEETWLRARAKRESKAQRHRARAGGDGVAG
jgi:hypothetical protein